MMIVTRNLWMSRAFAGLLDFIRLFFLRGPPSGQQIADLVTPNLMASPRRFLALAARFTIAAALDRAHARQADVFARARAIRAEKLPNINVIGTAAGPLLLAVSTQP